MTSALRNSEPLSVSIPSSGNGNRVRACARAASTEAALFFRQAHVPMLFQQRHQRGQERQEPFGAHVVGRLPGQEQGLLHRLTVPGGSIALDGLLTVPPMV